MTKLERSAEPLAIPVAPLRGESLIGLVARATRVNVLGSTKIILEGAGLNLLHPGTIGQDIGTQTHLLARQIGCEDADIHDRCHPYLGDARGRYDVRWGSGALFRQDIHTQRRRISPASLQTSEHHRSDWMNLLLPYCPESLELLVDSCSACGKPLGWRRAWGIGHCDDWRCREPVQHPTGELLPAHLVDGYRSFARLVSADPETRNREVATLDPALSALPPAVLLNFMLQAGATLSSPRIRLHRGTVQNLPAMTIAAIACRGAELLADWPNQLRSSVAEELSRIGSNGRSRRQPLLDAVRRLGLRQNARPEQMQVMRDALPEAFEHAATALGGLLKPVVNGATVCRMAIVNPEGLRRLRAANLLEHHQTSDRKRAAVQYDLEAVTEFAHRKRTSELASHLEQRLGIPRYATEQLASLGEVMHEDHPCILHLEPRLRLRSESASNLIRDLNGAAIQGNPPPEALKLSTAMKRIGGRLKPWGTVLSAMRSGSMPYWLGNGRRFARSAYVLLQDVERFLFAECEVSSSINLPIAADMTQIDAIDVLNLDPLQIGRVTAAGELHFSPSGVALVTPRADVIELARRMIATAEIALRLGEKFPGIPRMMARFPDVRRCSVGWLRADFDAHFAADCPSVAPPSPVPFQHAGNCHAAL